MILKCVCQHCGVLIEFEAAELNQFKACDHCNQQTRLLDRPPGNYFDPNDPPGAILGAAGRQASLNLNPPPTGRINRNLNPCQDCGREISHRALMCPACGSTASVRFKLVWDVMCHAGLVALIFAIFGWLLTSLLAAAAMAWR